MLERPFAAVHDPATSRLVLTGAIDESSETAFTAALTGALADTPVDGRPLTIDLTDVDYLPSTAIAILVSTTRPAAVDLVAGPGTIAQRVLDICGLPHRVG